jgi:hypothetical protein
MAEVIKTSEGGKIRPNDSRGRNATYDRHTNEIKLDMYTPDASWGAFSSFIINISFTNLVGKIRFFQKSRATSPLQ